jgi:hypothetical protein
VSENGLAGTFDKDCLYFYDQTLRTAADVDQVAELFGSNAAILECPLAALVVAEEPKDDTHRDCSRRSPKVGRPPPVVGRRSRRPRGLCEQEPWWERTFRVASFHLLTARQMRRRYGLRLAPTRAGRGRLLTTQPTSAHERHIRLTRWS